MCARTAAVIASATRARHSPARAQREQRRARSRQAAAERAGFDGRALDRAPGPARAARGAARRSCPRATREISAKSPRCRPCDERAQVRPLPDGVGERHRVAEQRARLRRLDLEIRVHDHGRQAGGHRQRDDVRRTRRAGPARSRRRCDGAMLSACADPAPSRSPSSAQAISVSIDALRAEQRVDGDDRRRGARRAAAQAARQRQPLANASAPRRAARRACVSSASAATPAVLRAASRGRRPPSPAMSSIVHAGRREARRHLVARRRRARSRARRTRSATFETVAGAKAVTEVMSGSSC